MPWGRTARRQLCPRCGHAVRERQPYCLYCELPLGPATLAAAVLPAAHQRGRRAQARARRRQHELALGLLGVAAAIVAIVAVYSIWSRGAPPSGGTDTQTPAPLLIDTPVLPSVAPGGATPGPAATTPTPQAGFGATVTFHDWVLSLAQMGSGPAIFDPAGPSQPARGMFWALWVDARNAGTGSRTLASTLQWVLLDDQGLTYPEAGARVGQDLKLLNAYAQGWGRTPLAATVAPRDLTHPLLVFDVLGGAKPVALIIREAGVAAPDEIRFDLRNPPAVLPLPHPPQPTPTP